MGDYIETGRRERNTQLNYLVSITLKYIENKNKPFLCAVLNGSICRFLYIKKL
jgi:hypothetical protein